MSRPAIVVTLDGLGAGFLGPYGNTWIETPAFNRLASESLLCEQAWGDADRLETLFRAYWRGVHSAVPESACTARWLPERLAAAGLRCELLTDDPRLAQCGGFDAWSERLVIGGEPVATAAETVEDTSLAQLFAAAVERLDAWDGTTLLWLHARGADGPWDAPRELRERFVEEGDPPPPDFVAPPVRQLAADFDPDELLGLMQAYAAQVTVADECLGGLLDALGQSPARDALLVVTAPRGYPLGEHLAVGPNDRGLFGERLHVPWFVRWPDQQHAGVRTHALVQPADLLATLAEWWQLPESPAGGGPADCGPADGGPADCGGAGLDDRGRAIVAPAQSLFRFAESPVRRRDRACAFDAGHRAIRTPAWFLSQSAGAAPRLFVEPSDRWEAHDVADRAESVVQELLQALDDFQAAAAQPLGTPLSPLSDAAVLGLE